MRNKKYYYQILPQIYSSVQSQFLFISEQRSPAPPASQKQETSDGSKYGCNTYYEHKEWTFYDIESEMAKKRVGQPSPYKKTSH